MADQAAIQRAIYKGYAQAAQRLGTVCDIRRPAGGSYPGPLIGMQPVSLNAEDMKYAKPSKYGKPTWYALLDGTGLQAGDYLIGAQGTFFIAALQPLLPILVVECNRTASLLRVAAQTDFGAQPYGGMTADNEAAYAAGVPCSILQGTKGEKNDAALPAETRLPWWTILLPGSVGTVAYDDLLLDDLGRRYVISSAELTDLGYRCTAMLART